MMPIPFRSRFFFAGCAAFLLCASSRAPAAEAQADAPPSTLRKGDALLIHIEGLGGGLPEYREIVDSDGNIELPFLGFLPADGKSPAAVETEMANAYVQANFTTGIVVHIAFVTHFDSPPARSNLIRARDPRRPVSAEAIDNPAPPAPAP